MREPSVEAAEKAAWRERFRAARARLSDAERAAASSAILTRVERLLADARVVSLFWPLVTRGEVDVRPLLARLVGAGVTVALPVVAQAWPPRLVHRTVTSERDLVSRAWGLLEPSDACSLVTPGAIQVGVVPALGIGRDGSRLGYGGGFYDTFLASTQAMRVGVVWDACLVDALPTEATDARLDVVITEHETLWTSGDLMTPSHSARRGVAW